MKNILLVAAVVLSGCVAPPKPIPLTSKFDAAEHASYLAKGNAKLSGQAFLRQRGGGTVTCAGARVVLLPATPYFRESMSIISRGIPIENAGNKPGPENAALARESRCDAQGNFDFEGLPAGRYILVTEVVWTVASSRQGGMMKREVDVAEAAPNRVLLSDEDR